MPVGDPNLHDSKPDAAERTCEGAAEAERRAPAMIQTNKSGIQSPLPLRPAMPETHVKQQSSATLRLEDKFLAAARARRAAASTKAGLAAKRKSEIESEAKSRRVLMRIAGAFERERLSLQKEERWNQEALTILQLSAAGYSDTQIAKELGERGIASEFGTHRSAISHKKRKAIEYAQRCTGLSIETISSMINPTPTPSVSRSAELSPIDLSPCE